MGEGEKDWGGGVSDLEHWGMAGDLWEDSGLWYREQWEGLGGEQRERLGDSGLEYWGAVGENRGETEVLNMGSRGKD